MSSLESILDSVARTKPGTLPTRGTAGVAQDAVGELSSGPGQRSGGIEPVGATRLGTDRFTGSDGRANSGAHSSGFFAPVAGFDSRAAYQLPHGRPFEGFSPDVRHWEVGAQRAPSDRAVLDRLTQDPLSGYDLNLDFSSDALCRDKDRPNTKSKNALETLSERAVSQMKLLLNVARRSSAGRRPDGRCYNHVWRFITYAGYGRMPHREVPHTHARYAKQFAYYANRNLDALGLKKLPITNPYDAPAGAIVVVRPGAPGTAHPTAGDIAIAEGNGRFFNGGEMGYGGRQNFPPGNDYVLGIYVPR